MIAHITLAIIWWFEKKKQMDIQWTVKQKIFHHENIFSNAIRQNTYGEKVAAVTIRAIFYVSKFTQM